MHFPIPVLIALAPAAGIAFTLAVNKEDNSVRCGPDFNHVTCPNSMCCSGAGWCGTTPEYCYVPGNCQEDYGFCDSKTTPRGPNTSTIPRQSLSSLPSKIQQCSKEKTLALTYDDGPSEYTDEVLNILQEFNAHATFFLGGNLNGRGAIDRRWSKTVKRMYDEGHQIGSHTWSHPDLDALTSAERKEQMYKNERAIANVVGKIPVFMRAPMIRCARACEQDMHDLGYQVVD